MQEDQKMDGQADSTEPPVIMRWQQGNMKKNIHAVYFFGYLSDKYRITLLLI